MLCQTCKQTQATTHILEKTAEGWSQRNVCENCALGIDPLAGSQLTSGKVVKLFTELFGKGEAGVGEAIDAELADNVRCPGCDLSYEQFRANRRLGCSRCYEIFKSDVERILLKVQDHVKHRGKVPGHPQQRRIPNAELDQLRNKLQQAIQEERFEDAALFRDKMKELEQGE